MVKCYTKNEDIMLISSGISWGKPEYNVYVCMYVYIYIYIYMYILQSEDDIMMTFFSRVSKSGICP